MKNRSGLKKAVKHVPISILSEMHTGTLLARLKRLRMCEETSEHSYYTEEELQSVEHLIIFKSDLLWKQAYIDVKTILAKREHLNYKP